MSTADPPATLELVLYQLKELKAQRAEDRDRLDQLAAEMRGSFSSLAMVSRDVYISDRAADARIAVAEKKATDDYAKETRDIAASARQVAMAVLGLMITGFIVMLGLIKAVAK